MNSTIQQTPPSTNSPFQRGQGGVGGREVSSRVMHMAHSLQQTNPTMKWGEILKLAWQFQYFRDMLRAGIVKFSYLKSSAILNEPRQARGTLHPELIPEDKKPVGKYPTRAFWGTMAYYDLDRQDWRSFKLNLLYNVDAYITLNNVQLNDE